MHPDPRHQRLKAELKANGYSISRIAESIGVSVATVIVVSQGYRKSARVQAAIAKALNRRPEEIWPDRYGPEQTFDTRTKNVEMRHSQKSPLERHLSELRAERIRRRLREAGIIMKVFAASLGRPSSDVRAVMLGERWSDHIEGEIAKILNVRAADLWPERYNGSFLSPKHVAKEKIPTSRKPRGKARRVAGADAVLVAKKKVDKWILAITVRNGRLTSIREYVDTQALARAAQVDASGPA